MVTLFQFGGYFLAPLTMGDVLGGHGSGPFDGRTLFLGQSGEPGPDGGGELLPDTWYPEELWGAYPHQYGDQLPGVGAHPHVGGTEDRQIEAEHSFGDVGERQVAHVIGVFGQFHDRVEGHGVGQDVVVRDRHTLGVAGGSRRVDDGEQVVRGDVVPPLRGALGAGLGQFLVDGVSACRIGVVDHDQVFQGRRGVVQQGLPHRGGRGVFDHRHAGSAVPGDVIDLFGGRCAVDGGGDRSRVHHGQVGQPVFGAVAHHEQDVVTGFHAQCRVSPGKGEDSVAHLRPGERGPVGFRGRPCCLPGQGRVIGVVACVAEEEFGDGEVLGFDRGEGHGVLPGELSRSVTQNTAISFSNTFAP